MKLFKVLLPALMLGSYASTQCEYMSMYKNVELHIDCGDIIDAPVQAIVNAANEQLQAGGGVCGAIFAAAGAEQLQEACNQCPIYKVNLPNRPNIRCWVGHAYITPGFQLSQQYIIHAVGPDCRIVIDRAEQDELLQSAYMSALRLASQHDIVSIAFPFISSAIYAFPKERAAKVAMETIYDYIDKHGETTSLKSIHMVLYSRQDYDLFLQYVK